ncbi:nucleotidyltransferase domain-containing protein [Deinococcus aluminii]
MPDLSAAQKALLQTLGSSLERGRSSGVFHLAVGGPGSVPALTDLDVPELHLDLLPDPVTEEQRAVLTRLGYLREAGEEERWSHPGGWRLVLPDSGSGWRAEQAALRALLLEDAQAAARYRRVFRASGRGAADQALQADATAHHVRTVGFRPARFVADTLQPLGLPWMFAGGLALDLHLGRLARPHDDLDVVLPRAAQLQVRDELSARGWRLDACREGAYHAWSEPLLAPWHQAHARHPDLPDVLLLDLLLTDLEDDLWRYRRDPRVTLPLAAAHRVSPDGLPYLAPEAALLFKSGSAGRQPRGKDQRDFERLRPTLTAEARAWLAQALRLTAPEHPWLVALA